MSGFDRIFNDIFNLFFPNKCVYCGNNLTNIETEICINCLNKLPKTNFIDDIQNPVFQKFWGRVNIEFAVSMYYFVKHSMVQYLFHQIKYKGRKELAKRLGQEFGLQLNTSNIFKKCDALVPVPLHPKKQKKRGYNQSEWIAKGISDILSIPVETGLIQRHVNSTSQTRKNRKERWENVRTAFSLYPNISAKYTHILLIDDVVTTGATLESCSSLLINKLGVKVSIASLAYATD